MHFFRHRMAWLLYAVLCAVSAPAQQSYPVWDTRMPNSRHLELTDSIFNQRAYRIGMPRLYVYETGTSANTGTAVLIIPSGGFTHLTLENSGWQLAKWYNTLGVTAFVLLHRLPQSPDVIESYKAPIQDAQRAVRWIRAHAGQWGIDVHKVGVMGCSAGGYVAAAVSVLTEDWAQSGDAYDTISFKPDFTVLVSPVITMGPGTHQGSRTALFGRSPSSDMLERYSLERRVGDATPPAFLVHAADDPAVSPQNSIAYFSALQAHRVSGSSLHIFPAGAHSIALRNNPGSTAYWTMLAEAWLTEIGMLSK
ncbi:MAG: alpha/beta hydrolase [Bacteroidales bacterium]|nr:alpha/beta hydrolase [Bacteroidales bacterium]MCR5714030.1 alpha/beta hydrolase [Bacteroidales bacterium]